MAVLVESCEPTKSGKAWRVKLGGNYYNAFKDSGIENHVGKMIEAEITTSEKYGAGIKAFRLVTAHNAAPQVAVPTAPIPPSPAVAAPITREREPQYAEPAKPNQIAPWWGPMASNTIAHAIAAGILKSPNEVNVWYRAVKIAAENQDSGDGIPF